MASNWRKSSYSGDNGGECVEVALAQAVLGVHISKGYVIPGCFGHAVRPRSAMLSGA